MKKLTVHFSSETGEWSTPPDFLALLVGRFGEFDLDPCATAENAKAAQFYTKKQDGLKQEWFGNVFCNPPYGTGIGAWIDKAIAESEPRTGTGRESITRVVLLVPARTDTAWFKRAFHKADNLFFVKGRLKFGGHHNAAPFPSAVFVFTPQRRGKGLGPSVALVDLKEAK